jgi:hypothetical protein
MENYIDFTNLPEITDLSEISCESKWWIAMLICGLVVCFQSYINRTKYRYPLQSNNETESAEAKNEKLKELISTMTETIEKKIDNILSNQQLEQKISEHPVDTSLNPFSFETDPPFSFFETDPVVENEDIPLNPFLWGNYENEDYYNTQSDKSTTTTDDSDVSSDVSSDDENEISSDDADDETN